MQGNENIRLCRKNHTFTSYPAAKHQNAANLGLQTYEKSQWTFLLYHMGVVDFNFGNKFTT